MQCRLTVWLALSSMCMIQHSMGLTVEKSQRATLETKMGIAEVATRFLSSDQDEQDKMLQDPYVLQAIWRHMNEEEPVEAMHVVMVEAPEGEASQGEGAQEAPAAPVAGVNLHDLARAMAMKVLKATKAKMEAERAAHHAAKHMSDEEAEAAATHAKSKADELKEMAHKAALEMGRAARAVEGAHSTVVTNTAKLEKKTTPVVSAPDSETTTCNQRLAEVENRLVAAEDRLKRVRAAVVVDFDTTAEPAAVATTPQTAPQQFSTSLEPRPTPGRSTTVQEEPMPVAQETDSVANGMADDKDLELEEKELNAEDQKLHHIRLQEVEQDDE